MRALETIVKTFRPLSLNKELSWKFVRECRDPAILKSYLNVLLTEDSPDKDLCAAVVSRIGELEPVFKALRGERTVTFSQSELEILEKALLDFQKRNQK